MGLGVGLEGFVHGSGFAGEPGEVAPFYGELFGCLFGRLALDGVGVEGQGEAGAVGTLLAVDEEGFGGGAHELHQCFHFGEGGLDIGGERECVEVDAGLVGEVGFADVPVFVVLESAEVEDAAEGRVFAADFLPLVVGEGGGAVEGVRDDDGEVAVFDEAIVPEPAEEEDGEGDEDFGGVAFHGGVWGYGIMGLWDYGAGERGVLVFTGSAGEG